MLVQGAISIQFFICSEFLGIFVKFFAVNRSGTGVLVGISVGAVVGVGVETWAGVKICVGAGGIGAEQETRKTKTSGINFENFIFLIAFSII